MRIAALAVVVIASLGCKDSSPRKTEAVSSSQAPSGATSAPDRPALARPQVTGPGLVKVDRLSATIVYSKSALELDDTNYGKLRDGVIPKEALERLTRQLEPAGASGDPIGIGLDPALPYVRVSELLFNLKTAGFRNLALLTAKGEAVPLELLDADQVAPGGIRPVVTVRGGQAVLWSMSGMEGSMQKPKATLPATGSLGALTQALTEIVQRRWPDQMRPDEDRTIIVQISKRESAELLLQVLAAVRADGNRELFPHVFLAGGI